MHEEHIPAEDRHESCSAHLQEVVPYLLQHYLGVTSGHALGAAKRIRQQGYCVTLPAPVLLPAEGFPALHQDLTRRRQPSHASCQIRDRAKVVCPPCRRAMLCRIVTGVLPS